jgi:hypothetical protein
MWYIESALPKRSLLDQFGLGCGAGVVLLIRKLKPFLADPLPSRLERNPSWEGTLAVVCVGTVFRDKAVTRYIASTPCCTMAMSRGDLKSCCSVDQFLPIHLVAPRLRVFGHTVRASTWCAYISALVSSCLTPKLTRRQP